MRKSLVALLCMIMVLSIALTACKSESSQNIVSEALNIDVSSGSEVSHYDTHSGNGDGVSCIVLSFSDSSVLEEIKINTEWKAFPLDETMQALVYGVEDETEKVGPFLSDGDGNPLVAEIQNGYYCLIDRHSDTETNILERHSFNFTVGLYDTDTDTLYFCELDT
ncbi:hypothetical protein LI073_13060 [bacterium 210917-SL.2.15]|nr:hypothetical protein [bacterium 210917-SL.2.15]